MRLSLTALCVVLLVVTLAGPSLAGDTEVFNAQKTIAAGNTDSETFGAKINWLWIHAEDTGVHFCHDCSSADTNAAELPAGEPFEYPFTHRGDTITIQLFVEHGVGSSRDVSLIGRRKTH